MICWYCHWGWPKPVADIYRRAVADIDATGLDDGELAMEFGPAHIVWSDENWDCADFCLQCCDDPQYIRERDPAVIAIVRRSLQELQALPPEVVDVCPDDYDGEHPESYPPPAGVEMVKV